MDHKSNTHQIKRKLILGEIFYLLLYCEYIVFHIREGKKALVYIIRIG